MCNKYVYYICSGNIQIDTYFLNTIYALPITWDRCETGRGMIEGGLKVRDSFGDVTKIKYCGLKGLVWSLQSREVCTNDLENTSSLCLIWRMIISARIWIGIGSLCQLVINKLTCIESTYLTNVSFWCACNFLLFQFARSVIRNHNVTFTTNKIIKINRSAML